MQRVARRSITVPAIRGHPGAQSPNSSSAGAGHGRCGRGRGGPGARRRRRARSRRAATGSTSGSASAATGSRSPASASSSSSVLRCLRRRADRAHAPRPRPERPLHRRRRLRTRGLPVGPWTHVSHGAVSGAIRATVPGRRRSSSSAATARSAATSSCGCSTARRPRSRSPSSRPSSSIVIGVDHGPRSPATSAAGSTRWSPALTEMAMVFPALLFIIAIAVTAGHTLNGITFGVSSHQGVFTLTLIFGSSAGSTRPASFAASVLSLREKEFVEAARMIGASDWRIMRSHLLPHLVGADHRLLDAHRRAEHPRRGRASRSSGSGSSCPTASWGNLLASAPEFYLVAAAGSWSGRASRPAHDARLQPPRRRPARRVRSARSTSSRRTLSGALTNHVCSVHERFSIDAPTRRRRRVVTSERKESDA